MAILGAMALGMAGIVEAASQHTLTLNYDFSVDNACSSSVTTGCLQQFNIYDITGGGTPVCAVLAVGAQFVVFLRWIHRRMRDDEIQRVFIRDLALKHLPSIYRALNRIAEEQGISLEETPMVNYVDMRNGGRNR
jgi:hypothetical protein